MKKILYFSLGFIFLLLIFQTLFYTPNIKKITEELYLEKTYTLKTLFFDELKKKQESTNTMAFLLSQDSTLIDALSRGNSEKLDYKNILDYLGENGYYKNLWIHVIDKNGNSFYRSWTNKKGDEILSSREDIEELLKEPKAMQSLSAGLYDLSLKSIQPIYDNNNNFLGFIEINSKLNSIAINLKKEKVEPIFILSKDKSKKLKEPFSKIFIKDNYIANINANREILELIERKNIDSFIQIDDYIIMDNYLVTNIKLNDTRGEDLALFIMFFDIKNLNKNEINSFKNIYLTGLITFLLIYGLIFLYLLKTIYAKSLNKEVQEKTKSIKNQQKKMSKLLDIYDKNVIFSRTDLKGVITHASSAFCKISGYSKKELVGKPHSIVRHPDMQKELFEHIWSEIKEKKRVTVEIKNLRKDGSYYWVVADFEPEYDENNKHIGYFAIREDITANKDIEELQREIIFTMGSIAESRSKETGEHVKRVAKYSKLFAKAYGLSKEDVSMLELASPMHDIGKIAIPDEILNKPAKLTFEEFEIMKTHAQKGFEMLNVSSRPLFQVAAEIALTHHEKYDGTGYPNGLKGEDIPIFGRITAIADVFDAISSDRCYKKAWEQDKVLEYIKSEKGKHFDPKLVDILFENLDEILKIKDSLKDIYN